VSMQRIIDLSQPLYDGAPGATMFPPPSIKLFKNQPKDGFNLELIHLTTHSGTHIDAPYHFFPQGKSIDKYSLEELSGPSVVVNLTAKLSLEPITVDDLKQREQSILPGYIVLLDTGWGEKRSPKNPEYFNSPYLTEDGAQWLVDKRIKGVGIDHFSVSGTDYELSVPPHLVLLANDIWIAEDLYFPSVMLEDRDWYVMAIPLLLEACSGAPARVFAFEINENAAT